jgi:hypothetical protein
MITPTELLSLYHDKGILRAANHVADGSYAVPSLNYLTDDFPEWWLGKLKERGLGKWETTWDCDNFAWTFFTDIQWAHYNSRKSNAEGIAVGVMYYMSGAREEDGTGGGHAINTAIVGKGADRRVVFLEPQKAARGANPVIELNSHEIESVWFLNF